MSIQNNTKKTLKARDIERLENTSFASALLGGADIPDHTAAPEGEGTFLGCSASCEESACCVKSFSCEESACCINSISCETACSCACFSVGCCITFTCPSIVDVKEFTFVAIDGQNQ